MKYTIKFYALEALEFVHACQAMETHDRVLETARSVEALSKEDLRYLSDILRSGLDGRWPRLDTNDAFVAFDWLLEQIAEPLQITAFREFNRWCYWRMTGLTDIWVESDQIPFSVPVYNPGAAAGISPFVIYLPNEKMPAVLSSPEPEAIPREEGIYASRLELLEAIESLSEEGLDMLGICFGDE